MPACGGPSDGSPDGEAPGRANTLMARKATGQVVELERERGRVFALRFRAYGQREYQTLGTLEEGSNRSKAEEELQNVLSDVRRGVWRAE